MTRICLEATGAAARACGRVTDPQASAGYRVSMPLFTVRKLIDLATRSDDLRESNVLRSMVARMITEARLRQKSAGLDETVDSPLWNFMPADVKRK